jgi:hypothetical protein
MGLSFSQETCNINPAETRRLYCLLFKMEELTEQIMSFIEQNNFPLEKITEDLKKFFHILDLSQDTMWMKMSSKDVSIDNFKLRLNIFLVSELSQGSDYKQKFIKLLDEFSLQKKNILTYIYSQCPSPDGRLSVCPTEQVVQE